MCRGADARQRAGRRPCARCSSRSTSGPIAASRRRRATTRARGRARSSRSRTARAAFPRSPGVAFPTVINELALPDFGPGFTPPADASPAAAGTRAALSGVRRRSRSRRARHRRHPTDGSGGADGDDHRLGAARGRTPGGRSVRAERLVHPVCGDAKPSGRREAIRGRRWRSATASKDGFVKRRRRRRAPARQGALPAAGRRRPLRAGRTRRRRAFYATDWRAEQIAGPIAAGCCGCESAAPSAEGVAPSAKVKHRRRSGSTFSEGPRYLTANTQIDPPSGTSGNLPGNRAFRRPCIPRASMPQPDCTATYCLPSIMKVDG